MFGGWDTPVCFNDMFMLDLGKYCKNCYSFKIYLIFNPGDFLLGKISNNIMLITANKSHFITIA